MTELDREWRRLQDEVIASYSDPAVVDRYRERASGGLRRWEEGLLERVHTDVGSVLVVGCGTGREAFALADRGWQVIGVDVTPALLEIAVAEARRRALDVDLELTDGARLPMGDASVTAVTLWSQILNNVPTRAGRLALLEEAHRCLVPGGTISFSVHDRSRTMPKLVSDQIVSQDVPEAGDLVLRESEGGVLRLNHYFDDAEIRTMCLTAGFDDVRVWHCSDLGEVFDNLFVVAAEKPKSPLR